MLYEKELALEMNDFLGSFAALNPFTEVHLGQVKYPEDNQEIIDKLERLLTTDRSNNLDGFDLTYYSDEGVNTHSLNLALLLDIPEQILKNFETVKEYSERVKNINDIELALDLSRKGQLTLDDPEYGYRHFLNLRLGSCVSVWVLENEPGLMTFAVVGALPNIGLSDLAAHLGEEASVTVMSISARLPYSWWVFHGNTISLNDLVHYLAAFSVGGTSLTSIEPERLHKELKHMATVTPLLELDEESTVSQIEQIKGLVTQVNLAIAALDPARDETSIELLMLCKRLDIANSYTAVQKVIASDVDFKTLESKIVQYDEYNRVQAKKRFDKMIEDVNSNDLLDKRAKMIGVALVHEYPYRKLSKIIEDTLELRGLLNDGGEPFKERMMHQFGQDVFRMPIWKDLEV